MCDLLPTTDTRAHWAALRGRIALPMSGLQHTALSFTALAAAAVAWPVLTMWSFKYVGILTGLAGLGLAYVYYMLWARVCRRLACVMPADWTVGSTAKDIAMRNLNALRREQEGFRPDEVWDVLHTIVVERLRVKPEQVYPEARFSEDLNAG